MVAPFPFRAFPIRSVLENWRALLVLVLVIALAAVIAQSYVGHSPGPYGTCYAPSGRSIPCELDSP